MRSEANYRYYSETDIGKMELICLYRDTGMSLKQIKQMLSSDGSNLASMLEERLRQLNQDIQNIRQQQHHIIDLLKKSAPGFQADILDKSSWVSLLIACGMKEEDMWRWHAEFERMSPRAHQEFLATLNISPDEINSIRKRSAKHL